MGWKEGQCYFERSTRKDHIIWTDIYGSQQEHDINLIRGFIDQWSVSEINPVELSCMVDSGTDKARWYFQDNQLMNRLLDRYSFYLSVPDEPKGKCKICFGTTFINGLHRPCPKCF
jgi:hypothetical protein